MHCKELYEKRSATDIWEGFPTVLVNLLYAIHHSDGDYCVEEAIRYLDEYDACENAHNASAKLIYVRWVDRFFRDLYPLFSFEYLWRKQAEKLEAILNRAERYLRDISVDYEIVKTSCRTETGFYDVNDLVCLTQDLDMFFCTLYWHQEKKEMFEERFNSMLESTKRNMEYVLLHEDAAELWELEFDGMDGFQSIEFHYWQTIVWIYHECGAVAFPQYLIEIYEDYINFLYNLNVGKNWKVRNEVVIKAENDLQWLYNADFERMTDEELIPAEHYGDYYDEFNRKVRESEERVKNIRQTYGVTPMANGADKVDGTDWDGIWSEAKYALRDNNTVLSYDTWISPLRFHRVDKNKTMYLIWPNKKELIKHIEDYYLLHIEQSVKEYATEINKVEIIPDSTDMQDMYYHKTWLAFTNKLKDYMDDYPTLPVVIFREIGNDKKDPYITDTNITECTISYAHDPNTGEFREKVIAIYVNKPYVPEEDVFNSSEIEVPF